MSRGAHVDQRGDFLDRSPLERPPALPVRFAPFCALGLYPISGRTRLVGRITTLGHNPLQPHLGAGLQQRWAIVEGLHHLHVRDRLTDDAGEPFLALEVSCTRCLIRRLPCRRCSSSVTLAASFSICALVTISPAPRMACDCGRCAPGLPASTGQATAGAPLLPGGNPVVPPLQFPGFAQMALIEARSKLTVVLMGG
jgi:hypothetical protein